MRLPSPGFLLRAFLQVCQRFPSTMLSALVGVIALLLLIERGNNSSDELLTHIWMVAQLGLALQTGILVYAESAGWPPFRKWGAQALGLVLLGLYAGYLSAQPHSEFETLHLPRFLLFMIVAHLCVSVAPYLNRRPVADFWEYNRRLFANFVVGATFTLILFAGLGLAVLAIDQLFAWDPGDLIYGRLFILLAGIFNTAYFLYHFPERYEFETEDASYNAVFRNLCKYILIPIVGLYFLILYAYGAKIVATWSLPRGFVGSLVIGFSVAGIFTYLLNFYLPQFDDTKIVRGYKKWFWPVLLPLTALLFAAIGKRIGDYGVTEPRYIVLVTGIWLAIACVYFLISKSDNIKFIPISLAISALVISIGPWSAFSVAERSQTRMLREVLERNGRWENGKIKPGTTPMLQTEISQVESSLEFLSRREKLEHADWLPMPLDSFPKRSETYYRYMDIIYWLGLQPSFAVGASSELNIRRSDPFGSTDIRGYSAHYPINLSSYTTERPLNGYCFERSADGKKILWLDMKNGQATAIDSIDLQATLRIWRDQTQSADLELSPAAANLNLNGKKGSVRIRVSSARIEEKDENLILYHLEGDLFLKEGKR